MPTQPSPYWDFADAVANCDYGNSQDVVQLITGQYTPLYYEKAVMTVLYENPTFWRNSVVNMFPTENWDYGLGEVPIQEVYTPPYIPQGVQNFQNDTLPPNDQVFEQAGTNTGNSQCVFCYMDIPFGGFFTMKGMFVRRDYMTPQICVREIASARLFWKYAQIITESRRIAEDTAMIDFKNLVQLYTAGHKILLETDSPLAASNPPQALLTEYPETYLRDLFPQIVNYENVQPLTYRFLNKLAQRLSNDYRFSDITEKSEMGPMYKLRVSEDWFFGEIVDNPQFTENLRYYMPDSLFRRAYNPDLNLYPGQVGSYKNWSFIQDSTLPRYAPDGNGGLVQVQKFITTTTQNGDETIYNKAWDAAPFGIAYVESSEAAKLMSQGPLTTNQGISIPNVQGINWEAWNPYDRDCNPEMLLPRWKFHFRMGFKPWKPWTAIGILYRRRQYEVPESPNCNLYPLVCDTAVTESCDELNGACSGRSPLPSSPTQSVQGDEVVYDVEACGGDRYVNVRVKFQIGRPNGLISCTCGGSVLVTFSDGTTQLSTLLNSRWASAPLPYDTYLIDLGSGNSIPEGECITLIQCVDGTPASTTITACVGEDICEELAAGQVYIYTAQPLVCSETQTEIEITGTGGSVVVTIEDSWPEQNKYLIEAVGLDCADVGGLEGATIVCQVP